MSNVLDTAEKVENWFAEQHRNDKQILLVEWTSPDTGRVKLRSNSITLPLFKRLQFFHPGPVSKLGILFVCTEGVKLGKLQGNNTKYGGPGIASSAGCLYAGEVEMELKRAVGMLRENKVNLKVHEWVLELCRCPFISELDIASSRSFGQKRTMSMRMRDDKQSSTAAAVTNTAKGLSLDTPAETEASRAAPKAKSTRPLGISLDAPTAQ